MMRFIFNFIKKDKQGEGLVEKLLSRFKLDSQQKSEVEPANDNGPINSARSWRDMSFCLSLLPFNTEKSIKRVIEALPLYSDCLADDGVYKNFLEITVKVRLSLKYWCSPIELIGFL